VDASVLHDTVLARLRDHTLLDVYADTYTDLYGSPSVLANLDVFDGSVDDAGQDGVQVDPDGRAHMYAVLYFSPGRFTSDRACGAPDQLQGSFQVTAAGGDVHRALVAATKVRSALTGVRLTDGSGLVNESTDPGTVREDPSVSPSRWYVPILFDVFNV
jgi:hypothetical protein